MPTVVIEEEFDLDLNVEALEGAVQTSRATSITFCWVSCGGFCFDGE
ncbi:FDLD family class I lanthipeptide [Streptomyces sp. NPDC007983]